MNIKRGLAAIAVAAVSLTSLAACGNDSAQDSEKPESLSFWYYEEDDGGVFFYEFCGGNTVDNMFYDKLFFVGNCS